MADEQEEYEVIDLTALRRNRTYLQKMLGDVTKKSAAQQVAIGGAAGCVSGYLSMKVGKAAALTIGGSILIIRLAFVYDDLKDVMKLSGYLFIKVGKFAAFSLGTTLVVVQVAQHQGYIQINWNKVNREVNRARKTVEREAARQYPNIVRNVRQFIQENVFLAGSFAGGFLIGMAF